jgi:type II secretory pathway pseudopilin PulG
MLTVILGMLVALVLAAVVLAAVAVPARQQGREVLTSQGEELVSQALERTSEAMGAARTKVGELADRLPLPGGDDRAAGRPASGTIDLREAQGTVPADPSGEHSSDRR